MRSSIVQFSLWKNQIVRVRSMDFFWLIFRNSSKDSDKHKDSIHNSSSRDQTKIQKIKMVKNTIIFHINKSKIVKASIQWQKKIQKVGTRVNYWRVLDFQENYRIHVEAKKENW